MTVPISWTLGRSGDTSSISIYVNEAVVLVTTTDPTRWSMNDLSGHGCSSGMNQNLVRQVVLNLWPIGVQVAVYPSFEFHNQADPLDSVYKQQHTYTADPSRIFCQPKAQ